MTDNEFEAIKEGFKHVLDRVEDMESKLNVFKDKNKDVEPSSSSTSDFSGRPEGMHMEDINVHKDVKIEKEEETPKKDRSEDIKSFWDKKIF